MTFVSAQQFVPSRGPLRAPNNWPKSAPQSCENPSICCERYVFAGTFSQFCCESLPFAARFFAKGDIFANHLSQKKGLRKCERWTFAGAKGAEGAFSGARSFGPKGPKIGLKADSTYLYTCKTPQNPKSPPGGPGSKSQKIAKMSLP